MNPSKYFSFHPDYEAGKKANDYPFGTVLAQMKIDEDLIELISLKYEFSFRYERQLMIPWTTLESKAMCQIPLAFALECVLNDMGGWEESTLPSLLLGHFQVSKEAFSKHPGIIESLNDWLFEQSNSKISQAFSAEESLDKESVHIIWHAEADNRHKFPDSVKYDIHNQIKYLLGTGGVL